MRAADGSELRLVLCVPSDEERREGISYRPGKDYTIINCPLCSMGMYIGPKSKQLVQDGKAKCMCAICARPMLREDTQIRSLT